jgi:hypothetical protein
MLYLVALTVVMTAFATGRSAPTSGRSSGLFPSARLDDADHLTRLDGLPSRDREVGDDAVAVRADLVLHLHRLDDAEDLPGRHVVALGDRTSSTVPCIGLTTASRAAAEPCPAAARSPPAASEAGEGRFGHEHADVEAAAVELHGDASFP